MQTISILIMLLAVFMMIFFKRDHHLNISKKIKFIREKYYSEILLEKTDVSCESNTFGLKNEKYIFKKCDLIIFNKTFAIIPFYKIGNKKVFTTLIFVENNFVLGHGELKRLNLNSFDGDVYIEFGESGLTSTNVAIRLKHLSPEEKALIPIKQ